MVDGAVARIADIADDIACFDTIADFEEIRDLDHMAIHIFMAVIITRIDAVSGKSSCADIDNGRICAGIDLCAFRCGNIRSQMAALALISVCKPCVAETGIFRQWEKPLQIKFFLRTVEPVAFRIVDRQHIAITDTEIQIFFHIVAGKNSTAASSNVRRAGTNSSNVNGTAVPLLNKYALPINTNRLMPRKKYCGAFVEGATAADSYVILFNTPDCAQFAA